MYEDSPLYLWEDVYITAGRTSHYMANHGGKAWSFSADVKFPLFGSFGHLRPLGEAPRVINLRELDWRRMWGFLSQQFGSEREAKDMETWWIRSAVDRLGGWDRFMVPGPGCPTLAECARGVKRPCVVQQKIRVKLGAADDYLQWFSESVRPAAEQAGWMPMKWMKAVHSPFVVALFAAPDWGNLLEFSRRLPQPESSWHAEYETAAMRAWDGSGYLQRESANSES